MLLRNVLLLWIVVMCSGWTIKLKAQDHRLILDVSGVIAPIQPTMYGIFYEDINFAADGGLYPERVKNRSFDFDEPLMGWHQPNSERLVLNRSSGWGRILKVQKDGIRQNICRITVHDDEQYLLINEGFDGMGVHAGATYRASFQAVPFDGAIRSVNMALIDSSGTELGKTTINLDADHWKTYESSITATQTLAEARLKITFEGQGVVDMDMISLFPEDTWKNRRNGLRRDLVQLLYDLKPGFLRFPGGCIVEGRTLAKRYQWKKTVGPVTARPVMVNRWNTEFAHRLTPDYFQSFGLGFYEYFQLAEDLGAAPMPILGCGMACQFNTGELVPLDELQPYIQDALDLIEFANGSVSSTWGGLRAEMGHPEPFGLKYLGIGNEQWGPEYIERYERFAEAIESRYPDIVLISSSGPFPEGDFFEYGMKEFTRLGSEIIDEHYYQNPEWFRNNADRYDNYSRTGPRIFAGEYAAQSVRTVSPENRNNWETALSEAAFMTGLERNADLVHMTSYAPLMAHANRWQWRPDLIWFDNLTSFGTPNYYVQKLFSNHKGTHLLKLTGSDAPLIGQKQVYASAVLDSVKRNLIVKLVNTSPDSRTVLIDLTHGQIDSRGTRIVLKAENLQAENSFNRPKQISPQEDTITLEGQTLDLDVPGQALVVYRFQLLN